MRFGLKPTKLANLQAEQMLTEYASYQQIGVPLKAAWVAPNYSFATRVNDLKASGKCREQDEWRSVRGCAAQSAVPPVTNPEEEGTMVLVMAGGTGALKKSRSAQAPHCKARTMHWSFWAGNQQPLLRVALDSGLWLTDMKLENVVVVKPLRMPSTRTRNDVLCRVCKREARMEALMHKYAVHLLFLLASCLRVFEQVKKPGLATS